MTRSSAVPISREARDEHTAEMVVTRRSRFVFGFFARIFAYDLSRSFHAIRLQGTLPEVRGPLIIVANHPSWWDAALFTWLAATAFPDRRAFAPIDAAMLQRYRFFGRLGAFAVKPGSVSSAAAFLAIARRVLSAPDALLYINAEGRFRDARARPLTISPGLAHLARAAPVGVTVLPMAIEYAFWDERRPNLLLRFGEPIPTSSLAGLATRDASLCLADALTATMDALADAALTRDPTRFITLLAGRVGINAFYDFWRGGKAIARGERFSPAHRDHA